MKNILQEIAAFLGGKFALAEQMFATKDSVSEEIAAHNASGESHADLRSAIGDQLSKGDSRDNITTFMEASVRANIVSGETHATLFGKIRKWFSDLRGMAFKDGVNLSAVPAAGTVTVSNDCGSGAVLPAATAGSAGVMTAADRQKMIQLFDGTMFDSGSPSGYHKHNYLELSDLPPTVELAASSYAEFKAAVEKLQAAVAKGKYGKIIVTGTCKIDDDTEFDLTNIDVECMQGGFLVTYGPLRVRNASVTSLYFDTGGNDYKQGYEALRVWCNVWGRSRFGTLKIDRCAYDDETPQITIFGDNKGGKIYCDFDRIVGYYSYLQNKKLPCLIRCSDTKAETVIKINTFERTGIANEICSVKIVSSDFDKVHLALSKDVLVENIDQLENLSLIAGELFDMRGLEVSVPTPPVGLRRQGYVLNALGEWVPLPAVTVSSGEPSGVFKDGDIFIKTA